jgi:hypothetical protein
MIFSGSHSELCATLALRQKHKFIAPSAKIQFYFWKTQKIGESFYSRKFL